MKVFGRDYLYKRLNELGISQAVFANKADLTLRYVSRLLTGERGRFTLVLTWFKIADALELPIGKLMEYERDYQIKRNKLIELGLLVVREK